MIGTLTRKNKSRLRQRRAGSRWGHYKRRTCVAEMILTSSKMEPLHLHLLPELPPMDFSELEELCVRIPEILCRPWQQAELMEATPVPPFQLSRCQQVADQDRLPASFCVGDLRNDEYSDPIRGIPTDSSAYPSCSSSQCQEAANTSVHSTLCSDEMETDGRKKRKYKSAAERKPNVPWTKREHIDFLKGLKAFGKGNWKQISAFVKTKSATQVASHAQKYFKRLSSTGNKRKIGRSILDITSFEDGDITSFEDGDITSFEDGDITSDEDDDPTHSFDQQTSISPQNLSEQFDVINPESTSIVLPHEDDDPTLILPVQTSMSPPDFSEQIHLINPESTSIVLPHEDDAYLLPLQDLEFPDYDEISGSLRPLPLQMSYNSPNVMDYFNSQNMVSD